DGRRVRLARAGRIDLTGTAPGAGGGEHRDAVVRAPGGGLVRGKGLSYLIVGPFAIVLAYPFYVMVITAFKDQTEFYDPSINPYWFGKHSPTLSNASFLFHHTPYPR